MVASEIMKILLTEHLGYKVNFHYESSTRGAFERTHEASLKGQSYISLEIWTADKQAQIEKYIVNLETVRSAGQIGYPGLSGFFVPAWLSKQRGVSAYDSFNASRNDKLYEFVAGSSLVNFSCTGEGASCSCCEVSQDHCEEWCPSSRDATGEASRTQAVPRPFPLLHIPSYDRGYAEAIIENNNFDMAIKYVPSSDYIAEVQRLWDTPFAFYYWEPTVFISSIPAQRLFLPMGNCGHMASSGTVGSWRCDYQINHLWKIASADLKSLVPPAWKLLQQFKIPEVVGSGANANASLTGADMKAILASIDQHQRQHPDDTEEDFIRHVACDWLVANEKEGWVWSQWVQREVPRWADVIDTATCAMVGAVMILLYAGVICVWERIFVRSTLFTPQCCRRWRRKARMTVTRVESLEELTRESWVSRELRRRVILGDEIDSDSDDEPKVAAADSQPPEAPCTVCFQSPEFIAEAQQDTVSVRLSRFGDCRKAVTVSYQLVEGDALPHRDFLPAEGDVRFEPDQASAEIAARLRIHNEGARMFYVKLLKVTEGEAKLLDEPPATVHTAQTDEFFCNGVQSDATNFQLINGWLRTERKKHKYFLRSVACRIYVAAYEVLLLTLVPQFIVDEGVMKQNYDIVPTACVILVPPMLLLRWVEKWFTNNNGLGPLNVRLREQITRKLCSMSTEAHVVEAGRDAHWQLCFIKAGEVVQAYANLYVIAEQCARLVFSILGVVLVKTDYFRDELHYEIVLALSVFFLIPPIAHLFLASGLMEHGSEIEQKKEDRIDKLFGQFLWMKRAWPLLRSQRPLSPGLMQVYMHFIAQNKEYQANCKQSALFNRDADWSTIYLARIPFIALLFFGSLTLIENSYYGQRSLSVGAFYAMLSIFSNFGSVLVKLSRTMMDLGRQSAPLRFIKELLEVSSGQEDQARALKENLECFTKMPEVPKYELKDLNFSLQGCTRTSRQNIFENLTLDLPLGCTILVNGVQGSSTHQLLRLLASEFVPTTGTVTCPPIFRKSILMHSHPDSIFPNTSVIDNVMLCAVPWFTLDHARLLCAGIGLADKQSGLMHIFKHTNERQMHLLEIARTLASDPNILLMNLSHMPHDATTERAYLVLYLWVRAGGLRGLLDELRDIMHAADGSHRSVCQLMAERVRLRRRAVRSEESNASMASSCIYRQELAPWELRSLIFLPASVTNLLSSDHVKEAEGIDYMLEMNKDGPERVRLDSVSVRASFCI